MRWLAVLLTVWSTTAFAVQPDEVLEDPALEARARELSGELRCLVCRNESIDESNAGLARDLRLLVRERLVAGDTDDEVIDFVTDRYGEFVLLRPTAEGANLVLWVAGPLMLVVAVGVAVTTLGRRGATLPDDDLTDEERARLGELTRR
jgi:cytochrome c-type biogenesis protein CcmH